MPAVQGAIQVDAFSIRVRVSSPAASAALLWAQAQSLRFPLCRPASLARKGVDRCQPQTYERDVQRAVAEMSGCPGSRNAAGTEGRRDDGQQTDFSERGLFRCAEDERHAKPLRELGSAPSKPASHFDADVRNHPREMRRTDHCAG
jgi:hypothetical protein